MVNVVMSRLLTCAALSAAAATAATAQETGASASQGGEWSGLETITVTAQRRTESVQEVPLSMSVLSSAELEASMVRGASDYVRRTPNIFITDGASRSGHVSQQSELNLAIRGISNLGGTTSSYGFYVDEFNVTKATLNPHLVDIDRIEVLRGPQGTFYGRNASGGVISVYTKKPQPHFEGEAAVQYGRFGTGEVSGMLNVPVSDTLFLRGVAKYAESDGELKNMNAVGGGNGYDHRHARLAARFQPSDELTVDVSYAYTNEAQDDFGLVHTGLVSNFIRSICAPPVTCPRDSDIGFYPNNRTRYNHDNPLAVEDEYSWFTSKIEYRGERYALTGITGYITSDFHRDGELDFASVDFLTEDFEDITRRSFSQELRLQSLGDSPLLWTVGAIYAVDTHDEYESINFGAENGFGLPDGFPIELSHLDERQTSTAVFAEAYWQMSDAWKLTLGGRYSRERIERAEEESSFGDSFPLISRKRSFTDFSPRIALSFQPTPDVNFYASVSKGWKAGGFTLDPQGGAEDAEDTFAEETLMNYEIGMKSMWLDNRLRFNVSLFDIDWEDVQVQATVFGTRNGQIVNFAAIENAASATSRGIEVELELEPIPALQLGLALGYNEAEFDSFPNATTNYPPPAPAAPVRDLSGQPLPKAPELTASASAQYGFAVGAADAYLRAEWSYVDETYTNIRAIDEHIYGGRKFPFLVPSFSKVNLRAGFDLSRYSIVAFVENALDDDYYTSSYDFGFVNGSAVYPSYRTYGVRLTARFE